MNLILLSITLFFLLGFSLSFDDNESPKVAKRRPRIIGKNLAYVSLSPNQEQVDRNLGEKSFTEGSILLMEGNNDCAFKSFQVAANNGHIEAQHMVGVWYLFGEMGARKDPYFAEKFLKMAADNGNVKSQSILGAAYLGTWHDDDSVARLVRDHLRGKKYLNMALKQNDISAAVWLLGHFIENGKMEEAKKILKLPFVIVCNDNEELQVLRDLILMEDMES